MPHFEQVGEVFASSGKLDPDRDFLDIFRPLNSSRASLGPTEAPPGLYHPKTYVSGNRRVERDTMLAHIVSRPGDPYDEKAVQRDAQALRDTGYFKEVRLKVYDDSTRENGKVVVFNAVEKSS